MADGYAVKELLKVTTVLYDAMKATKSKEEDGGAGDRSLTTFDIGKVDCSFCEKLFRYWTTL